MDSYPVLGGVLAGGHGAYHQPATSWHLRDRLFPRAAKRAEEVLVLITHSSAGMIGLKVDEVRRIVTVNSDALLPPPPLVRGVRGELLIAVIPHGDEVYLLIDLENVLTRDEKVELRDADLKGEMMNVEC